MQSLRCMMGCPHRQESKEEEGEVQQFATGVPAFSSQYGGYQRGSSSYKASCLIGGPTNFEAYGDFTSAHVTRTYGRWWLKGPSGGAFVFPYRSKGKYRNIDFVDLKYGTPCRPDEIRVYETLNPGSIIEVWGAMRLSDEIDISAWTNLWSGPYAKPSRNINSSRELVLPLEKPATKINMVRLVMEQTDNWYYSEFEAVKLIQHKMASDLEENPESPHDVQPPSSLTSVEPPPSYSRCISLVPSYMDLVPEDAILHILETLELRDLIRFAGVSRRYREIIAGSKHLMILDLREFSLFITPGAIVSLIESLCPRGIRKLDLSHCGLQSSKWTKDAQFCFSKLSPQSFANLTNLRLNGANLDVSAMAAILKHRPKLRELSIANTKVFAAAVTSVDRNEGPDKQPNYRCLSTVNGTDCRMCMRHFILSRRSILHSNVSWDTLEALNISNTDIDPCQLYNVVFRGCPRLRHLDISNCSSDLLKRMFGELNTEKDDHPSKMVDLVSLQAWRLCVDKNVFKEISKWTNLEELDVGWSGMEGVGPTEFRDFAKNCPRLKKIVLSCFRGMNDSCLDSLVDHCQKLEQIDLVGCGGFTKQGIQNLFRECHKMEHADLSFCGGIDRQAYSELRAEFPQVELCCCNHIHDPGEGARTSSRNGSENG